MRPSISRRFVVAAAVGFAGLSLAAVKAQTAQFRFRAGNDVAAGHPVNVWQTQMWKAVERESGGRLHVDLFPNSQLGADPSMLSQLREGALHFFYNAPAVVQTVVPASDITDVGFAFRNADAALRAVDGPLGDWVRAEFQAKNIYCMRTSWDGGMRQLTSSSHPIHAPGDMKGFKVRVAPSKMTIDLFRTLGASPTPLPAAEVYTALQTKVVEGDDITLVALDSFGLTEVQRYVSLTNHTWSNFWGLVNGDAWRSLPPDIQAVVERNNRKYGMLQRRNESVLTDSLMDKMRRLGLEIHAVDQAPFRSLLGSYYQTWAREFGSKAWGLLEAATGTKLA